VAPGEAREALGTNKKLPVCLKTLKLPFESLDKAF
jgi:hypothetical protein